MCAIRGRRAGGLPSPHALILFGVSLANRNFIIATSSATVYHLTTDGTRLEKLFVEPRASVCAISCHPYQPLLAVGSTCGLIKVWDYEQKRYLFSRVFEKGFGVQSLTYNPEGDFPPGPSQAWPAPEHTWGCGSQG